MRSERCEKKGRTLGEVIIIAIVGNAFAETTSASAAVKVRETLRRAGVLSGRGHLICKCSGAGGRAGGLLSLVSDPDSSNAANTLIYIYI
jgi:hypothetical protein